MIFLILVALSSLVIIEGLALLLLLVLWQRDHADNRLLVDEVRHQRTQIAQRDASVRLYRNLAKIQRGIGPVLVQPQSQSQSEEEEYAEDGEGSGGPDFGDVDQSSVFDIRRSADRARAGEYADDAVDVPDSGH